MDEMISLTDVEGGLWLKRLVPDRGFNQRITKPSVQYSPSDSFKPFAVAMLMYGKEASNRKQEIDRQHYTIPNQRPKDKHCGKI